MNEKMTVLFVLYILTYSAVCTDTLYSFKWWNVLYIFNILPHQSPHQY